MSSSLLMMEIAAGGGGQNFPPPASAGAEYAVSQNWFIVSPRITKIKPNSSSVLFAYCWT